MKYQAWIKFMRSEQTKELLREPLAFALLSLIANRARRTNAFNKHGLTIGQSLIGDFKSIGLTRQQYRTALSKLVKWGFVTTKTTTKGTIATIIDNKVYDININGSNQLSNQTATNEQPSSNHQATTNKNDKNDKNDNNDNNVLYTLQQVSDAGFLIGFSDEQCQVFFDHYNAQGWSLGNGLLITDLSSAMTRWRNNSFKFEPKKRKETDKQKSTDELTAESQRFFK